MPPCFPVPSLGTPSVACVTSCFSHLRNDQILRTCRYRSSYKTTPASQHQEGASLAMIWPIYKDEATHQFLKNLFFSADANVVEFLPVGRWTGAEHGYSFESSCRILWSSCCVKLLCRAWSRAVVLRVGTNHQSITWARFLLPSYDYLTLRLSLLPSSKDAS